MFFIGQEGGALYYEDTGNSTIDVTVRDGEAEFREDYRLLGERAWDVFHNGLSKKRLLEIREFCHNAQVSVNDYLLAALFSVADTEKIVLGADVRDEISCYRPGALGNYSSAIGIAYKNKKAEFTQKVREIHRLIEKYRQDKRKWMQDWWMQRQLSALLADH